MPIPTEPIGSIPRPRDLIEGLSAFDEGRLSQRDLERLGTSAIQATIELFEATGSPVITDGEQTKPSCITYPILGLKNFAPDGMNITFADGHTRQLPRLITGPFRYRTYADSYVRTANRYAHVPLKQAVVSASALSLLYPQHGVDGYSRDAFIQDLLREHETDIHRCLQSAAHVVQIDFTEGRLALKLDPTGQMLRHFVELNNRVLDHFSVEERKRIGVHTCPGGDDDSTHSADVDYAAFLPYLFELKVGNVYIQLASERDRPRVLRSIQKQATANKRIFVGVIDPLSPRVETPQEVRDRVLEAAEYIPPHQLGTTDDCGFAPFSDDTSTSREIAFEKIRARVVGTALAAQVLRVGSAYSTAWIGTEWLNQTVILLRSLLSLA